MTGERTVTYAARREDSELVVSVVGCSRRREGGRAANMNRGAVASLRPYPTRLKVPASYMPVFRIARWGRA